jgi:SAM-dependent methyltransferase
LADVDQAFKREPSERFWDDWNRRRRFRDSHDRFMQRQTAIAAHVAKAAGLQGARILGFGSGTGWLENELVSFGEVWGSDLSPEAIAEGQRRFPGVNLLCCDFLNADLPGPFDYVLSADAFVPMADHAACVRRVADLLRPGGTFLLMTQNPFVWARRSRFERVLEPIPHADPRDWPTRNDILRLLAPQFTLRRVFTFDPGGDQGLLWWVENAAIQKWMNRLLGEYRWQRLMELAGLGRELVFVATRN